MKKILTMLLLSAAACGCNYKNQHDQLSYRVDQDLSKVEWKGTAKDHFHTGGFKVNGSFKANNEGVITEGKFILPIASITNHDLTEPTRKVLLDDLKSINFFNMAVYPDAKFTIKKVEPIINASKDAYPGSNYLISGDFEMLGKLHPLSIPAKIISKGDSIITQAKFDLDRTAWGMNIYSDPKKDLYIFPEVNITLYIKSFLKK